MLRLIKCRVAFFTVVVFFVINTYSQVDPNDHVRMVNRNLKALSSPSPDVAGGYTRDESYEGVKGSPLLFDGLKQSLVRVQETDLYVAVEGNIDLKSSSFLYREPESGQLYSIPAQRVTELYIDTGTDTMVFRTTEGRTFKPDFRESKFFQILNNDPLEFIRIPRTTYIPADYKGGYSADRRYDEYKTEYDYYVMNSAGEYIQTRLTRKSLMAIFPEKKEQIKNAFRASAGTDKEQVFLAVIKKLKE